MKSYRHNPSFPNLEEGSISKAQIIYLDKNGYILSSTNTLFSTILMEKKSIFEWSPFLESIYPSLFDESVDDVTQFMRVTTVQNFLPGIYDYTFVKLPEAYSSKEILIWIINDRTDCYERMTKLQQIDNERMRARFEN